MSQLLTSQELEEAIEKFASKAYWAGRRESDFDSDDSQKDAFLRLIQSQKLAHADMVIGEAKHIDLASKYEEFDGAEGIYTTIDSDESAVVIGERLALFANFIADKTANDIYAEQRGKNKL